MKHLKQYYYIKDQDGFNMSCCKLDDMNELYCVRYLGTISAYFGEHIIPGNFSNTVKSYILSKEMNRKISFGENFFWNNWNEDLLDNTIFFVGSYNNGKFTINNKIEPHIISNKKACTLLNEGKFKYNDIRLININNNIYCYDGLITSIYQIKIIDNKIYIPFNKDDPIVHKYNFIFLNKLCKSDDNYINKYEKIYDKNWSLIDIITINKEKYFEFLNWYEKGYVTNTIISINTKQCYKKNIIKMDKDIINGLGTDNMPMFSFSSGFIKIADNNNMKYNNMEYCGIATGHTKLILSKKYNNVNIDALLKEINEKLLIMDNYIQHNSYIYMCYFIKLIKHDNKYKMFISDSFIYIDMKKEYIFSICFPMGLFEKNDNIILSCGYGDYYNMLIEFDKQNLLNNIYHDVSNFDISNYKFKIIYK